MTCTVPNIDAIKVNMAWTSAPMDPAPSYQDIAADGLGRFHGVSISRGRSYETERFQAGTMDLQALDYDRDFEALYSLSPFYPYVKPRRRVQFIARWNGTDYPQFTGFTGKITNRYNAMGQDPRTVLACTDGFRALSKKRLTETFDTEEPSGTRIMRILDAAGWPGTGLMTSATHRALDTGNFEMPAQELDDTSALEAIYHVELSEFGRFFIAANGAATFIETRAVFLNPLLSTAQDVFGDDESGAERFYQDIVFAMDDERIHNKITASRMGGAMQTAIDQASIDEYFETVEPVPELLLLTDNEAFDYAYYRLGRESQPQVRVEPIRIYPNTDPDMLWPLCLTDNFGYRYTVRKRPRAGGAYREVACHIEGKQQEWDFEAGTAFFTFQMSIADPSTPWIREAAGIQLGVNTYLGR